MAWRSLLAGLIGALALGQLAGAEGFRRLDGHGGPIMGIASSADGSRALTASFDNAVGLWTLDASAPPRWLEGHEAAVNRAIFLPGDRAASGGDDDTAILWDLAAGRARHRLTGHQAKIRDLALSPDGAVLATASWDWTVRLWDVETGAALGVLEGHDSGVNAVAFAPDGTLYSGGNDGAVIAWDPARGTQTGVLARHGFGVNRLAVAADGTWLAYGALDGGTRILDRASGEERANLTAGRKPILALALAPDGKELAIGDGEGHILVVGTEAWEVRQDFRAAKHGPIWALAYAGANLLAGGIEDAAYLWPANDPESRPTLAAIRRAFHTDPETVENGARQFLRKCSVCHSLTEDGARRAGPTLAGIFGRRAGTHPGYLYSDAVKNSGLIWTGETIDQLFDLGPDVVTPGSKMPVQRIQAAEDRADLIAFLRRETQP